MGRPLPWRRGAAYPRTVILAGAKGVSTMAQNESQTTLLRLSDTELTVANPAEDVRGRKVIDKNGETIGEVSNLIVDDRETRVRFLEVASGGLFGLGRQEVADSCQCHHTHQR
jgi:PRC-barrel domain protein